MTNKNQQPGIVFPFTSEIFMDTWELWKNYKKETFGFVYKGLYSEQMTLKKLTELSGGEEEKAIRIVEQSIMQQWQGLFPLHIPKIKEDGKSGQASSSKTTSGNLRERVVNAANKRYNNNEQAGNSSNT